MKKSNNSIGIIIISCVLGFAGMKAFDIEFNLHNIKVMLAIIAASVITLMLLFSLPSKSHEKRYDNYYKENNEEDLELAQQKHAVPPNNDDSDNDNKYHQDKYHQDNSQAEEDNRYNQYQQPYQNPYEPAPPNNVEEDNRWS